MSDRKRIVNEFGTSFDIQYKVLDELGKEIGAATKYAEVIGIAEYFAKHQQVYVVGICAELHPADPIYRSLEQVFSDSLENDF